MRSDASILRSRAIGVRVGSLIGAGWMGYGLSQASDAARWVLGAVALAIVAALLLGARRIAARARRSRRAPAASRGAERRVRTLFWINLAVEIVLLNVAVNLLAEPPLRVYWIPAISLVVGLHFLPMASFFRVPSYIACGSAMILLAASVALALRGAVAPAAALIAGEAIGNAAILWATAAWGLRTTFRRPARIVPTPP